MNYSTISNLPAPQAEGDCLFLAVYQDKQLSDAADAVDQASQGAITNCLSFDDFTGKAGETQMLYQADGINAKRILLVGVGEKESFDAFAVNKATKTALKSLSNQSIGTIYSYLADDLADQAGATIAQGVLAASDSNYKFTLHKSDHNAEVPSQTLTFAFSSDVDGLDEALNHASGMALGCELSRDLSNQPGNVATPSYLAETAMDMAKTFSSLNVEVLEEADMEKLGMGSFMSVSKGSDQPGKMVIIQYKGAADDQAPVALVGKGVTFDTGGISLKPGASMDEMKFDMVGAASVLGTIKACAEMKLPINVVGVLAAAENMPSSRATKPGDIVKSMSGKTIEVLNTDAEGRLVLCDALTYVGKYEPRLVIDIATLTGACIVALGHEICAVLANDQSLADEIMASGKSIGDQAWQLPMNDDYQKLLKSAHADIGNIGGKSAGTITAACFLGHFTKDYRWAHLDIAGTAWQGKDATGRPVPLLTQFLIDQVK
ncbi:leucyl aminopeptidase [Leucothrix pacifica]|uniref:Probable cytosol aminopeptidase n=1 Tax=Leucothrix pacifica TaxID=1247513 RepID=A0A317C8U1_9GAMM|nr:leucyl aminopeptidase [Leucothrix pacifica]PWQ94918.1 leucyl aminopeptidase [Leucothrix pacifica]